MKTGAVCMRLVVVITWAMGTCLLGRPATATATALQGACPNTYIAVMVQLMPCRQAVVSFSPAPPSEACCDAVRALGQVCLCDFVNGPPIRGVDRNVALTLPSQCSLNYEPCEDP